MQKKTVKKIIVSLAVIAALSFLATKFFTPSTTGNVVKLSPSSVYALDEVSKHNTKEDCWIVLHDKVYDVTGFIALGMHGKAILQGCGKDATSLYETRPMGSGTPHSENARKLSEKYYIGDLKK